MYNGEGRQTRHWIGLGFLAVFAVFVVGMLALMAYVATRFATPGTYPYFPWEFGFGFFGFFLILFLVFGLARWILFPWRWGYRRWYGPWGAYGYRGHPDAAYHVLRERYARGEITKEQYDAMLKDLYPQPRQGP